MTSFNPPHAAHDKTKLASLVESFRAGRPISPIVVNGDNALTGSHRIAAHRIAWNLWNQGTEDWAESPEPTLDTVECDDDLYLAAIEQAGLEPGSADYNALAGAIYAVGGPDLKSALEDQVGY